MSWTIDDFRVCPALAGPDDVLTLIAIIDELKQAVAESIECLELVDDYLAQRQA